MPFKSEKQKRYLWANEPKIAREWTDRYGAKDGGNNWFGQGGMKNFLGEQPMVSAPKYWQSAPDHEMTELAYITPKERDILVNLDLYNSMDGAPNEGPSGIMSLNGWGSTDSNQNRAGSSISGAMDKDSGHADWGGASGAKHGSTKTKTMTPAELKRAEAKNAANLGLDISNKNDYNKFHSLGRHKFNPNKKGLGGIGSLLASLFGFAMGIPGLGLLTGGFDKLKGGLGSLNETLADWREKTTGYRTQAEWEAARQDRIKNKRVRNLLDRKAKGLNYSEKALNELTMGSMPGTYGELEAMGNIDKGRYGKDSNAMRNPSVVDTLFESTYNDMIPGLETQFTNQNAPGPWNEFNPGGNEGIASLDDPWGTGTWGPQPYEQPSDWNDMSDIQDHYAFNTGTMLDNKIKNAWNTYKETGFGESNLQKLMEMDQENFEKKGVPLSLDKSAYNLIG